MSGPKMQVQRHAPIREQVASILRDAIVDMRLKPGELLVERQLCEMTLASRPSVREALRQLEAEGLVESQNGRGTYVSVVSPEIAKQVYEIRAELEGLAAQLFAERADEELRRRLRTEVESIAEIVESEDAAYRTSAILDAKNAVYRTLFEGAGNPILHQMVGTLHRRVNQMRALTLAHPGRPVESLSEIQQILEAVERRDGDAARTAAAHHVTEAARTIFSTLEQQDNESSS